MRILLVEDERKVAGFIRRGLREEGYAVNVADNGEEGLYLAQSNPYDLLILDIMLPKLDGLSVLRVLRERKVSSRVLLLTARSAVDDRVRGLDAGGDDYLTKPFAFAELSARVRALLRRGDNGNEAFFQTGDLVMDPPTRQVSRGGKRIELTSKEFALLDYLMRNSGRVLTRAMIEAHVWEHDFESGTNMVDVHINHLRSKIDRGFAAPLIETVRGAGYRLAGC